MNRNEKRREEIEIIVLIIYMLLMSGSVLNAVFSELFTYKHVNNRSVNSILCFKRGVKAV